MALFKHLSMAILSCLTFTSSLPAEIVVRGAFDIGSNETKLCVAAIDNETNQIVEIYYNSIREVALRRELANNAHGHLSEAIEKQLIDAINQLIAESAQFSPQQFFGVGTSAFRTAKNGQSVLERVKEKTGVTIHLAPQVEEGVIGLLSAAATSQKKPEEIICWDSGSGSFQMTTMIDGNVVIYGEEFGFFLAYQTLFKMRGIEGPVTNALNPMSEEEKKELSDRIRTILSPCPEWLLNKNKEVVGIGGNSCLFSIGQIATGKFLYTKEDIRRAMSEFAGKTDEELSMFPDPHKVGVALTLLYTLMDHCNLNQVTYQPTNGGCDGILLMPHYWQ